MYPHNNGEIPPFNSVVKQHGGGGVYAETDGLNTMFYAWFEALPKNHEIIRQQLKNAGCVSVVFATRNKWILKHAIIKQDEGTAATR
jgi:hypothetical protein